MRRPSWNKSQAIQQVISLKALLEPSDDDSPPPPTPMHHQPHAPQPQANLTQPPPKAPPPEEPAFLAADDIQKSASSGEKPTETNDTNTNANSGNDANGGFLVSSGCEEKVVEKLLVSETRKGFRSLDVWNFLGCIGGCATSGSIGQMTIFYCGKVNVYDGVSPDKARAIMQLAASPVQFTQDDPLHGNASAWSSPCHLPMDKDVLIPVDTAILQVAQAGSK
ncbi:hypothetical protein V8G54_030298 [Vigna mungo]|uniref:Protein TIFY n=1 Tax=Vigna mungo TaxID=3915 RepID=A0AAQ3MVC7_VIGMU